MDRLTFLLYILSQSVSSIRPMLVLRLKEWHERFYAEENKFLPAQFCHEIGLNPKQTERFCKLFNSHSPGQFEKELSSTGIRTVNLFEDSYPELLAEIPDPPLILYGRGNFELLKHAYPIAVVGSRRATKYGELAVQKLISSLAGTPVTIVSGLAYGIDAQAHRAALANNLPTIAVLGSGLDDQHIFPRENFLLAKEIMQTNGLMVSEYPPGTPAQKFQFIARNRIIAGLSKSVVIIEAAQKSGALLTAEFAVEYNRTIQAVPGSILSPNSQGSNSLIQNGAVVVSNGSDICSELGLMPSADLSVTNKLAGPEARVLEYIQHEAKEFENLVECSGLSVSELQTALTNLELKQVIKQVGPQVYQKI